MAIMRLLPLLGVHQPEIPQLARLSQCGTSSRHIRLAIAVWALCIPQMLKGQDSTVSAHMGVVFGATTWGNTVVGRC